MKKIWKLALAALFIMAFRDAVKAQWLTGINFQYLTNPTIGVRVGNTNTAPLSALTVLGTEMTPATGEVFRTYSPGGMDSYWRMFNKGAEKGNFFQPSAPGLVYNRPIVPLCVHYIHRSFHPPCAM